MTDIFTRTSAALETLSPAVPFAQAPFLDDDTELPDVFIAYQLITGVAEQHADDAETERTSTMQVSIFDRSGLSSLPDVDSAMLAAGFMKSVERQLPKDQKTGHYGISKEFVTLGA
jgi:hypothetical protein